MDAEYMECIGADRPSFKAIHLIERLDRHWKKNPGVYLFKFDKGVITHTDHVKVLIKHPAVGFEINYKKTILITLAISANWCMALRIYLSLPYIANDHEFRCDMVYYAIHVRSSSIHDCIGLSLVLKILLTGIDTYVYNKYGETLFSSVPTIKLLDKMLDIVKIKYAPGKFIDERTIRLLHREVRKSVFVLFLCCARFEPRLPNEMGAYIMTFIPSELMCFV